MSFAGGLKSPRGGRYETACRRGGRISGLGRDPSPALGLFSGHPPGAAAGPHGLTMAACRGDLLLG